MLYYFKRWSKFQPYIYLGVLHMNIAFKEEADYGYAKTSDSRPAKTASIS
jgi:hypothetical protein